MRNDAQQYLANFVAAWNDGDAQAYASLFTPDATYVIFLGEALLGRAEIEQNHVDVFARWQKGSKMVVKTLTVRAIGPNVRILLTAGGIAADKPVPYDKLQTFTLVRSGESWQCASFQNTAMSAQAQQRYNDEVDSSRSGMPDQHG